MSFSVPPRSTFAMRTLPLLTIMGACCAVTFICPIVSKSKGLFQTPLRVRVNDRAISLGGFYVHLSGKTNGFGVQSTQAGLSGNRIEVTQVLTHPRLASPTKINFRRTDVIMGRGNRCGAKRRSLILPVSISLRYELLLSKPE